MDNDQPPRRKNSYTERRKLFKNIWDAAIQLDKVKEKENEPNVAKTKVIKTVRISDADCINISNKKKQRIKNLRTVCTRLLEICNKQEAEELVYDQMSAERKSSSRTSIILTHQKKNKTAKRKKVNKTIVSPPVKSPDQATSFEVEVEAGPVTHRGTAAAPLRDMNSPRIARNTLIQQFLNERLHLQKNPLAHQLEELEHKLDLLDIEDAPRKVVKKNTTKEKLHRQRHRRVPLAQPEGKGRVRVLVK